MDVSGCRCGCAVCVRLCMCLCMCLYVCMHMNECMCALCHLSSGVYIKF